MEKTLVLVASRKRETFGDGGGSAVSPWVGTERKGGSWDPVDPGGLGEIRAPPGRDIFQSNKILLIPPAPWCCNAVFRFGE